MLDNQYYMKHISGRTWREVTWDEIKNITLIGRLIGPRQMNWWFVLTQKWIRVSLFDYQFSKSNSWRKVILNYIVRLKDGLNQASYGHVKNCVTFCGGMAIGFFGNKFRHPRCKFFDQSI